MGFNFESALHYLPSHLQAEMRAGSPTAPERCAEHLEAVLRAITPYLPAQVVRARLADASRGAGLGGAQGEFAHGTLMFSDISGFTAMSERLSQLGREGAEVITRIVNGYFETMLGIALSYGGDL